MEVIRRLRNLAAGIGHRGVGVGALALCHGGEHIHTLADGEAETQIQPDQVLVDKGELVITVQQILVVCAVAHNGWRELFSAVGRIIPGEGQSSVLDVLFHIVDVIDGNQASKILSKTLQHRDVLDRVQAGFAAILILLGLDLGNAVQTLHFIALGLHFFLELIRILFRQLTVAFGSLGQLDSLIVGVLVNLLSIEQFFQVIGKGNIVHIAVLFPLLQTVYLLGVVLHLGILGIIGKNQVSVQCGVDHDHNHTDHNNNRNEAAQDSIYQIFCHTTCLIS